MDIMGTITGFVTNSGQTIAENVSALVIGYLLGTVIPPIVVSKTFINAIVRLPVPKVIKIKLLRYLDLMSGQISKLIPDSEAEINKKYFS